LKASAKYKFASSFALELQFQREKQITTDRNHISVQTFEARDMINKFSQKNVSTGIFTYPVPIGGILRRNQTELTGNSFRLQGTYDKKIGLLHKIASLMGAE